MIGLLCPTTMTADLNLGRVAVPACTPAGTEARPTTMTAGLNLGRGARI